MGPEPVVMVFVTVCWSSSTTEADPLPLLGQHGNPERICPHRDGLARPTVEINKRDCVATKQADDGEVLLGVHGDSRGGGCGGAAVAGNVHLLNDREIRGI
jgi:hypothetical protein